MTEVLPSPADGEVTGTTEAPAPQPGERTTPFSRRTVAPAGVTPPPRDGSISATPPAMFRGARPVVASAAPAPEVDEAVPETDVRQAALEARRAQAAERPSWFLPAPPTAPVSDSPFALVSSRPEPAGPSPDELAEAARLEAEARAQAEQRAFYEERQRQLEAERAEAAARAELARTAALEQQRLGALTVAPPVIPPVVIPPVEPAPVEATQAFTQPTQPTQLSQPAQPTQPTQSTSDGLVSLRAPEPTAAAVVPEEEPVETRGRKARGRRPARKPAPAAEPTPEQAAALEARRLAEQQAQEAAVDAYRRFAREGTMVAEDYYRGPEDRLRDEVAAPALVIADSLIPTGKPRLAPQPDKPRGPKIIVGIVVLAIGAGAYYWTTHQTAAPVTTGVPPVTLDQTTAAAAESFTVPAASTSGPSYSLTVPAGWKAVSQPTRPGGDHDDVTVTEPILHLTVSVHSEAAGSPDLNKGTRVDTALRVFGRPAGIVALATAKGSPTVSRVATVTLHDVRYSVTLTVPSESAVRDYGRADVVARSLTAKP